ncbi:site-specific DNA-methyltransferase [Hyphobacterium sp. CCMP332]|nr:site-specific DNA-methyltransferase [Hyphobacterium sp. CCMP332]
MKPFFESKEKNFVLYNGDYFKLSEKLKEKVNLVYADPPYFLSSGGNTIHSGEIVKVDKGEWDKSMSEQEILNFNREWIEKTLPLMKEDATLWVSGTAHNIFSIVFAIKELGMKLLNVIVWQKTNPPPNFYTKIFKHSTEYIVFARKSKSRSHFFNHELLKTINEGKRMTDVWTMPSISNFEKTFGKHPTQKPLSILVRILLAGTEKEMIVLDPFAGSCTTGIAANLLGRKFIGFDLEKEFIELGKKRYLEIQDPKTRSDFKNRINDLSQLNFKIQL